MAYFFSRTDSPKSNIVAKNKNYEIIALPFAHTKSGYTVPVIRNGSTCILKHLIFKMFDDDLSIDDFKNIMSNGSYEIIMGGNSIVKIGLDLCMELNKVTKIKNTFAVEIPSFIIKKIYLWALIYTIVEFNLELCTIKTVPIIKDVELSVMYVTYKKEYESYLRSNKFSTFYQNIKVAGFGNVDKNYSEIVLNTQTDLIKGYFIIGNINNIKSLRLCIDAHDKFDTYDKIQIALYCHKITDKLLYVPYNAKKNYDEMTEDSFIGATYSSINTKMILEFDDVDNSKIEIYSIGFRYLEYCAGILTTSLYPHNSLNDKCICNEV